MHTNTITASTLKKLKRLAKKHRNNTGQPWLQSLEVIAKQAGYPNWKRVTVLAEQHIPTLMPAAHNGLTHWYDGSTTSRPHRCATVEEFCQHLGGIEPVLLRSHCHESKPGARCLCELDPFMTAKRADVHVEVSYKDDPWNYRYIGDKPYTQYSYVSVVLGLRLKLNEHYVNGHLLWESEEEKEDDDDLDLLMDFQHPTYD